jgi:hypothetical protein
MANNTNTYIANINLNRDRFDNVLTSLGGSPSSTQDDAPPDSSDGTGDPSLPSGKPPADPDLGSAGTPVGTGAVRINKSPTHNYPPNPTAPTMPAQPPQSILRKSPGDTLRSQLNDSSSDDTQFLLDSLNNGSDRVIHDKSNKLLKEMMGRHLTEFHVEDFAGLFPIWPIVKLTLAPSGASKDKRMTQYVHTVLALFGKILFVDEKAAIAPIKIMNDKPEDMITDKANIPTNFTKLSRWLMLSGGSWVFNKGDN